MIRVWVIFNRPLEFKAVSEIFIPTYFQHHYCNIQRLFRDYLMTLFVLCLAIIDVVILLLYTVIEATRDNLGVKLTSNRELPEETFGVSILYFHTEDE